MIVVDVKQGSPAWLTARGCIPTSSCFDMIVTSKGEPSKSRTKYLYKLAGQRVSGVYEESYKSAAMERGTEMEAQAKLAYEFINDVKIDEVGFCVSDCGRYGSSPDGLIGEDGLIEIKCPIITTQVGYLLDNSFPTDYVQQVQGELLVTGRKWADFFSFFPGMKPLQIRVYPDPKFQEALKRELIAASEELENIVKKLQ